MLWDVMTPEDIKENTPEINKKIGNLSRTIDIFKSQPRILVPVKIPFKN